MFEGIRAALCGAGLIGLAAVLGAAVARFGAAAPNAADANRVTIAAIGLDHAALTGASAQALLEQRLRAAAAAGARFVAVPGPVGSAAAAEPIPGPSTAWVAGLARDLHVAIAVPVFEQRPETPDEPYLSVVLIDGDGAIAYRTRTVLPMPGLGERRMARGNYREPLRSVEIGGVRVGILSSSDFVSGLPRLSDRGADVVLMVGSIATLKQRDDLVRSAQANHLHIAAANTRGAGASAFVITRDGHFNDAHDDVAVATVDRVEHAFRPPSALGLPATVPQPNRRPASAALVELGRRLFVDRGLSSTGTIACASCHKPDQAFADGRRKGVGVFDRLAKRNAPSVLNVAFRPLLRWDGYASSLENFVKYPVSGKAEMDFHHLDKLVAGLADKPSLREAFADAFPGTEMSFEQVETALAAYMRTLTSGASPFDRYLAGERDAMSRAAQRGFDLFTGKAGCAACHTIDRYENLLTDHDFHDLGVGWNAAKGAYDDIGLGGISTDTLSGRFLTPSLRDVARTAPYMHDGSIATLREVIDFLDGGGIASPGRDPLVRPLGLTGQEKDDLVSFLEALSGEARWDKDGRPVRARQSNAAQRQ